MDCVPVEEEIRRVEKEVVDAGPVVAEEMALREIGRPGVPARLLPSYSASTGGSGSGRGTGKKWVGLK